MKKIAIIIAACIVSICMSGCSDKKPDNQIIFAASADYPPFEYNDKGLMVGFDIDLGRLIAKELGKEAVFKDMQFSAIFLALNDGSIDAGISSIGSTPEREKTFDFSDGYYAADFAILYAAKSPLAKSLDGKKIACQLGSIMEAWLKENAPSAKISLVASNNHAVEALKAGHIDGVIMDYLQAMEFAKQNPGLTHFILSNADVNSDAYRVAFKKGSGLKDQVNHAIKHLKENGELDALAKKWLGA